MDSTTPLLSNLAEHLLDTVREPLLVLATDLRVRQANRSFYRTFGVTPQETEGRLVYELGSGQWDIPALRRLLEGVLPQRESFEDLEVANEFPSLGRRVMLLNARRVVGDGNDRAGTILLAIEDITERRRFDDERRELETRFTTLVNNVRDHSIFTLDPHGRITSWNVGAGRILGFGEAEVIGRHFSIIFTDEDRRDGIPEHELRTALNDGRAEDERWQVRKGGERFWALGIVTPTHDANGRHTGFSKILRDMRKRAEDVTERQQWVATLADTRRKLDSALIAGEVGTFEWDVANDRLWGDRNFQRIFGIDLDASGAAPIATYVAAIHPADRDRVLDHVRRSVEAGCDYVVEYRVTSTVPPRWVIARGKVERDGAGRASRFPGVVLDVTERKQVELLLAAQNRALERMAAGESLAEALGVLTHAVEEQYGGEAVAAILLIDEDGCTLRTGAAPGLPAEYNAAVDGLKVKPGLGTCADAAARNEVVVTPDLAAAPSWQGLSHLPLALGLKAAWSMPIRARDGRVLGTFGTYFRECREPTERERQVVEGLCRVAALAIDQRRSEGELRQSEERLRAVFEQTEAGIAQVDLTGRFVLVNDRYCQIVGRSRQELLGLRMQDVTHPDDLPRNLVLLEGAIAAGTPFLIEKRYVRPDGSLVWVSNSVSVMRGHDGTPTGIIAASVDITDRKLVEERLRTSEERLALSISAAELGTFYCPMPLGRIEWNDACKAHFWLPPDAEVDFDLFYSIIHPDDRDRTRRAVEQAVFDREPYDIEYRTVAPDGRQRWVRAKGRAYYDAAGNPVRFDGVTLDVTERRRAEDALRASERRFRDMADTAPAMLWVTEPDGYCSFLSRGWYEFTGQTEQEGLGFGWANAAHPDDQEAARAAFVAASRERAFYEIDFRVRRADGEYRWVIDSGRPRFAPSGKFLGFIGSVIDITERKHVEAERNGLLDSERAARVEAERAGRMKDEFLATLSHELRTPLNAILGWSQILAHGTDDAEDLAEGLQVIERNARAQTQIIEDLLDMSRIISGKVRLDVQRIDLAEVVREAVATAKPSADAKGVRLQVVLDPQAGPVSGDPARLQQVMWNLLTNAVKFTAKGGRVQVLLERVHSHLEVNVIDSGEGIPPDFLPHVFDRFRQADATTTRRHGGLGLGLSIVKQLVEMHGGSVSVKSAGIGQGTTFTVVLPLTVVHPDPDSEVERHHPRASPSNIRLRETRMQLAGVKVLVVDDEPDARALVKRLLDGCEAQVLTAGSAAEALRLVQTERPDVLVCDIGMPGLDGYSLIRRVRALGSENGGQVPAAALTAYARAEDRVKAILAGFQMHLAKPVEPAELIATVAGLAGRTGIRG